MMCKGHIYSLHTIKPPPLPHPCGTESPHYTCFTFKSNFCIGYFLAQTNYAQGNFIHIITKCNNQITVYISQPSLCKL